MVRCGARPEMLTIFTLGKVLSRGEANEGTMLTPPLVETSAPIVSRLNPLISVQQAL